MKKLFIFGLLLAFSAISTQAQLEVDSLGRVSILPAVNGWKPTLKIGNSTNYGAGVNIKNVGQHYSEYRKE